MSAVEQQQRRFGMFNAMLSIIVLSNGLPLLAQSENLPYQLTVVSHSPVRGINLYDFVDFDGDEFDEMITLTGPSPDYLIQFHRRSGEFIQQFRFRGKLTTDSNPIDLDKDGIKEYFVSEQIDNRVTLFAIWPYANEVKKVLSVVGPYYNLVRVRSDSVFDWQGSIQVYDLFDVDNDGAPDLIVSMKSNEERPRRIMAINVATGEKIWQRKIACAIRDYTRIDLDNDHRPAIVLATESLGSKALTDSTDDKHAYFMILDSKTGKFRHLQSRGGLFSKTFVYSPAKLGLPAHQILLAVVDRQQTNYFEVWDWRLRQAVAYLPAKDMKWHFITDVNRDKKPDLVFLDQSGKWQAVDARLKRIKSFPTALTFPTPTLVSSFPQYQAPMPIRLPGAPYPGIVAQFSNRSGFIVFDDHLQPIAVWNEGEGVADEYKPLRQSRQDGIFWSTVNHIYFFQLEPKPSSVLLFQNPVTQIFLPAGALLFTLALWLSFNRKRGLLISRLLQAAQSLGIGALVFRPPGRILDINRQAKEILNLGDLNIKKHGINEILSGQAGAELLAVMNGRQNGALISQRYEIHHKTVKKEIEAVNVPVRSRFRRNRLNLLFLYDVTEQYAARKATFWAKTAQKLAHDLKTPLSSILMAVDHLQKEQGVENSSNGHTGDEYIGHIRSEVTRMRKHTIGFVKFAELEKPKIRPVNINELLHMAVSMFEPLLVNRIQLNLELEENLPDIAADAKQMRIALNNLIDNAISAMLNGGTLTLRTYLVSPLPDSDGTMQEHVAIEVQDTGSGISPEILASIREQQLFITTKPDGTGVGLTQVQEIISDHQGEFEITSTPGLGTVVYIAIPIYREE